MRRISVPVVLTLTLALGLIGAADAEAKKNKAPKIAVEPMDDGKLVPSYFGEGLEFRETDKVDYLWVKNGFEMIGGSLHFAEWPEHEFVGEAAEKRDEDDHRLARMLTGEMARSFVAAFNEEFPGAGASLTEGAVLVEGRIVDCSTGSNAAKVWVGFGAGAGNTTIDLRFTDKETGELLAAIHHRVVSGTSWSTTESKFTKWISKLAKEIRKEGLWNLYAGGDPTNK